MAFLFIGHRYLRINIKSCSDELMRDPVLCGLTLAPFPHYVTCDSQGGGGGRGRCNRKRISKLSMIDLSGLLSISTPDFSMYLLYSRSIFDPVARSKRSNFREVGTSSILQDEISKTICDLGLHSKVIAYSLSIAK